MADFNELEFVRITDPNIFVSLQPPELLEQVKERDWAVDDFLYFAPLIMTQICVNETGQIVSIPNKMQQFYWLINSDKVIKGVLWLSLDPLTKRLMVNLLSVDKEYQSKNGEVLEKTRDFAKAIAQAENLKDKVLWTTTRPGKFEKVGAKQSNKKIMEV